MSFRVFYNRLRFYSGFILLAFYLTVGILFLFTDVWADLLPKGRFLIGIILILWGILRFYVAYRRYINKALRLTTLSKTKENDKEN
jgi:cytochrome c biogenesis protein CcdA